MYKKDKVFCDVCGEETEYEGVVYYNNTGENHLCKPHYLKYCRCKVMIKLNRKYKTAKPTTKRWAEMCREKGEAFNEWFKEQKTKKK